MFRLTFSIKNVGRLCICVRIVIAFISDLNTEVPSNDEKSKVNEIIGNALNSIVNCEVKILDEMKSTLKIPLVKTKHSKDVNWSSNKLRQTGLIFLRQRNR